MQGRFEFRASQIAKKRVGYFLKPSKTTHVDNRTNGSPPAELGSPPSRARLAHMPLICLFTLHNLIHNPEPEVEETGKCDVVASYSTGPPPYFLQNYSHTRQAVPPLESGCNEREHVGCSLYVQWARRLRLTRRTFMQTENFKSEASSGRRGCTGLLCIQHARNHHPLTPKPQTRNLSHRACMQYLKRNS